MNPFDDPVHRLIQETRQRINGFDALVERNAREFAYADRIARAAEPFPGLAQEMSYAERVMREIKPVRRIEEEIQAARSSQHERNLRLQDRMARSLLPMAAATATAVYSTSLNSLIKSQQALARLTTQFDVSRITAEITGQTAFASAMGSFTERILRETDFREALIGNLAANYASTGAGESVITKNYDELFSTLIRGFTETELTQSEVSGQTILWRFDAWLETLPPSVKKIVVGFIIAIMTLILSSAVDSCKTARQHHPANLNCPSPTQPKLQDAGNGDMCR